MLHDFKEARTTYLISATPGTLNLSAIRLRLQHCCERNVGLDYEEAQEMDPFCLHRIILADYIIDLQDRFWAQHWRMIEASVDTGIEYIQKPDQFLDQLKNQTIKLFRWGKPLRTIVNSVDISDIVLKAMAASNLRLLDTFDATRPMSLAVSAKEDLDYLQGLVWTLKEALSLLEKRKDDLLNLVRSLLALIYVMLPANRLR